MEKNETGGACSAYGESIVAYRALVENLRERDHLEDRGIDGRIVLRWVFRKWDVGSWTGLIWLRIGVFACGNEPSGSMVCWELLD